MATEREFVLRSATGHSYLAKVKVGLIKWLRSFSLSHSQTHTVLPTYTTTSHQEVQKRIKAACEVGDEVWEYWLVKDQIIISQLSCQSIPATVHKPDEPRVCIEVTRERKEERFERM